MNIVQKTQSNIAAAGSARLPGKGLSIKQPGQGRLAEAG
jgi:hypothetical protein